MKGVRSPPNNRAPGAPLADVRRLHSSRRACAKAPGAARRPQQSSARIDAADASTRRDSSVRAQAAPAEVRAELSLHVSPLPFSLRRLKAGGVVRADETTTSAAQPYTNLLSRHWRLLALLPSRVHTMHTISSGSLKKRELSKSCRIARIGREASAGLGAPAPASCVWFQSVD
jgi:hypothetical protein